MQAWPLFYRPIDNHFKDAAKSCARTTLAHFAQSFRETFFPITESLFFVTKSRKRSGTKASPQFSHFKTSIPLRIVPQSLSSLRPSDSRTSIAPVGQASAQAPQPMHHSPGLA